MVHSVVMSCDSHVMSERCNLFPYGFDNMTANRMEDRHVKLTGDLNYVNSFPVSKNIILLMIQCHGSIIVVVNLFCSLLYFIMLNKFCQYTCSDT